MFPLPVRCSLQPESPAMTVPDGRGDSLEPIQRPDGTMRIILSTSYERRFPRSPD
jgi:hypothetical protein